MSEAEQDDVVRRYLAALKEHPARRGRRRSPEKLKQRIADLSGPPPPNVDALDWLLQIQERLDLEAELRRLEVLPDIAELEQQFVAVGAAFAKRRGVTYAALRQAGVPTVVLRKAGLRGGAVA